MSEGEYADRHPGSALDKQVRLIRCDESATIRAG